MNFFEHNLSFPADISYKDTRKWILGKSYIPKKKWLKKPFSKTEYQKNKGEFIHFYWLEKEFLCANNRCKSKNVKCVWFTYNGIAPGVDETFAEFYCYDCQKFTFVEFSRDSS